LLVILVVYVGISDFAANIAGGLAVEIFDHLGVGGQYSL
jgi:hypothetical protein